MTRHLPAEWAPQDGVLLAWPHADTDWSENLPAVQQVFVNIISAIARFEQVVVVAPEVKSVQKHLQAAGVDLHRIRLYQIPTNDTWARDFGPITVLDHQQPLLLDFGFNAWGLKFAADLDNQITGRLHRAGGFGAWAVCIPGLILEGGSIDSDGAGTVLTTSACLLSPNRNPHLDRAGVEDALTKHLGARRLLWLEHGALEGDDTDAHIDTLARFCNPTTIAYVRCDNPADRHFPEFQAMEAEVLAWRTADGQPYTLIPLPWPQACWADDGHRLPATYANFLIINEAVLVPVYGLPQDAAALAALARAFPHRELIAIDCRPLIAQHGSLHCVTMQIPEGVLP